MSCDFPQKEHLRRLSLAGVSPDLSESLKETHLLGIETRRKNHYDQFQKKLLGISLSSWNSACFCQKSNFIQFLYIFIQQHSKVLEEERDTALLESLSELFTDKQKDLMFKVLNKEALTKTEREYYSRVVKKRLKALRNSDLQSLAQTLVGF